MELYLIRHGKTQGNLEGRYIGTTDEHLCPQGIAELQSKKENACYPEAVEALAVSPLLRCRETASLIFPGQKQQVTAELRETDFGLFENKNYEELQHEPAYQRWLDSNGTLPFPEGESHDGFLNRCAKAFDKLVQVWADQKIETGALVVHGGTIMAILSHLIPSSFYDWQVQNGDGFRLVISQEQVLVYPLCENTSLPASNV